MDAATWGFVGALAGTVIGASASIVTTIISGWNANRLQKNADALERTERARAFQRSNLLELQDSLQDVMRLIGRAHHEDMLAARESGEWGKSMLSEELNQGILLANRKLAILTERVANDELRSNLRELHQIMTNCLMSSSELESMGSIQRASSEFAPFMEKLGVVLRGNY
jgi:uncharacterized membrane protein YccC